MRTHHLFYGLLISAATFACSDTPVTPFSGGVPIHEPDDSEFEVVSGTVVSETELRDENGETRPLLGPQTKLLTELIGAEIRIVAAADEIGSRSIWIVEFRVLTVDGLPALDGTLDETEEGFAIVAADGAMTPLAEVPSDLMAHVGKRVWMTLMEGSYLRYGVLEN